MMFMMHLNPLRFSLTLLVFALSIPGFAQSPDARFGVERAVANAGFWQSSGDEFIQNNPHLGFLWLSGSTRSTLKCANRRVHFMGLEPQEILIGYEGGLPRDVTISLYNRGDAGEIDRERFDALVGEARARITDLTSIRPERVEEQRRTRDVKVQRQLWQRKPLLIILEWSETDERRRDGQVLPYRAEYVKATLTLEQYHVDMWDRLERKTQIDRRDLSRNVKNTDFGDVYVVGVPMVDQGEKGYCAVACMERLFRYYGVPVDQHEIAQIADSSAALGTSPEVMMDAIKRLGVKFRVRVKEHFSIDYSTLKEMVDKYNRLARRQDKVQIDLSGTVYLGTLSGSMDPELLRQARADMRNEYRDFRREIRDYVAKGVPLLWSVLVGVYPEEPPIQGMGGHMRLIVGYNDQTDEILYSDTWGNGHELKRLPVDQAWAMTLGLFTAESRDAL